MKVAALSFVTTLVLIAASAAQAQERVLAYVQTSQGRIEVHNERGLCAGEAKQAEYIPVRGDRVVGCWIMRGTMVAVVFLDGDVAQLPVVALQKPVPA